MIKKAFQDITNLQLKHIKLTIHKSAHRRKLLRWIYEVCRDFEYGSYTYIVTVLIIDAYAESHGFDLEEYQLIGISSLLLGAKIEESRTRTVSEYSLVTDGAYSSDEIIKRERHILKALDYSIPLKLPQFYFSIDYFNSNFPEFTLREKKEILNCFIAFQMEQGSCTKNMFLLYLESVGEMEKALSSCTYPEAVRFYIEHNRQIDSNIIAPWTHYPSKMQ